MDICVVYDGRSPYTTGYHVFDAFKELYGDKVIRSYPGMVPSFLDLYVYVDSGEEFPINTPKKRSILYAIDSFQNYMKLYEKGYNTRLEWWKEIIHKTCLNFNAFYQGNLWFEEQGVESYFIEMGINPEIYCHKKRIKSYDVCFVGGKETELRKKILSIIGESFNLFSPSVHGIPLREAALTSKCFLDIPPWEDDMLGQRFFEGYACKVPMVSQERPVLEPYLNDPGIFTYSLDNLEESLINAVNKAMIVQDPIERDIENMKWTTKAKFMVDKWTELQ